MDEWVMMKLFSKHGQGMSWHLKRCVIVYFIDSVNKLLGKFYFLSSQIKAKLFCTYCCCFYGCHLWCISSPAFLRCCTAWNIAVCKVLQLPAQSHTWVLDPLPNCPHISIWFLLRNIRFYCPVCNSSNILFKEIFHVTAQNVESPNGHNIALLREHYEVDCFSVDLSASRLLLLSTDRDDNYDFTSYSVKEFLGIHDGSSSSPLSYPEISTVLTHFLCT